MTTMTAGTLLCGSDRGSLGERFTDRVATALDRCVTGDVTTGGSSAIPRAARRVVAREVCTTLGRLLDVDLVSLLVAGWRHHDELVAAGRRTASTPGSEELVELGPHRVVSRHTPDVDIVVDGRRIATVHFAVTLTFDVAAGLAVVREGTLAAVRPGRCEVTGDLGCEGVGLATGRTELELPGLIDLTAYDVRLAATSSASDASIPWARTPTSDPASRSPVTPKVTPPQ